MSKLRTEAEIAAEMGVSTWTIRRWRLSEGLNFIKIGGRFYYRTEAVQAWLISRETSGPATEEPGEVGVIREIRA